MDNIKPRICKCGEEIQVRYYKARPKTPYNPKYCSMKCAYSLRVRPTGLDYNIVAVNKSWFPIGHKLGVGVVRSAETLEKMRLVSKGKRRSPCTEFKKGEMGGKNNVNWKGGITPENMRIRQSPEYKDWRVSIFERDNYTCVLCNSRGVTLHVDHIKPFAYFPELRLVIENGRTLCVPCHQKTPTYGKGAKKIYGTKTN